MTKEEILNYINDMKKMKKSDGTRTKGSALSPLDFTTGDNGSIKGYAATFDHDHGDSYGEVIRRGAFAKSLAARKASGHPFPLCVQHDFMQIIGRVVEIKEDAKGLYFEAEFFPTERAQEIRAIVKSGCLWELSFAYNTIDQGRVKADDGTTVNELREVELLEISLVIGPANSRATLIDAKDGQRLLKYINRLDIQDELKKGDLLQVVNKYRHEMATGRKNRNPAQDLAFFKTLEEEGFIAAKNKKGVTALWKARQEQAFSMIRAEIRRLESIVNSQTKTDDSQTKTGNRPKEEPKAIIK